MKKLLLLLSLFVCLSSVEAKPNNYYKDNSRIEIVNEQTVIFKNVVRIDVKTHNSDQITYVYDLNRSRLIKAARGSFEVELPMGNYLVLSNARITRTSYEVIVE